MRKIESFQMKKIYAIGHALGITGNGSEDELHILVSGVTGKDSIKELSYQEAMAVIKRLEDLQGGTAAPKPSSRKPKEHSQRPGGVTSGQQKKIWALMYELKKRDKSPNEVPLGDRLCAVIKKELHVDAIAKNPFAWLTFSQGNTLIEVLKGYLKSLERAARDQKIREEFDGGNYRELAAKYGLTERWVRFILFGKLDNLDDDMEGQMSIYDYPEAF